MAEPRDRKMNVIEEAALIALFITALCLPVLGMLLRLDRSPAVQENRTPAPFPALSLNRHVLASFPEKFKLYFEDHFGFRNTLIYGQAFARVKWLGVSSSDKVIVGKNGWLFLGGEPNIKSYQGTRPFSEDELARWQRILETRRNWLAERGIPYLFTIAPDKHTIYPEYMPGNIVRLREQSRLDQLIAYLRQHSDVVILDLRPALYEAKNRQRIYYKTDTHWNDYGAFVAYRSIIREVGKSFPEVQPLPESELEISSQRARVKDLAAMLGLADAFTEDSLQVRPPRGLTIPIQGDVYNPTSTPGISERKGYKLPRLVMFRDSFASILLQFLAPHFSRAAYVWTRGFDARLVEAERPEIVIQEMVERDLMRDPPEPPLELVE